MKLIRKLFIKDYTNVNEPKVREKHGLLASFGGIFINLLLFAFKLTIGIITFSMSIISDAINNLTDLFSCLVNLFGFKLSSLPADKRHPYGHERIEYIAGMIIAFIIISVSIVLGYTSITNLINHKEVATYNIYAFIILGGSILFKILLGSFYYSIGKAIKSESLKASMQDSFNDCFCTLGVLIAAIVNYFYPQIWWLDPSISLLIAIFILYSGIKAVLETASPLIGVAPDEELIKNITNDVLNFKCVLGIHDLTCHTYGHTKIFVTLHAEVDGYDNIMFVHDEIDNIEQTISEKYGVEITIHIDPVDTKNKELPILRDRIKTILSKINPDLTFHDLRMVAGPTHTNLLFDVVKSPECKISDEELENLIKEKIHLNGGKYNVIIKIDHKY